MKAAAPITGLAIILIKISILIIRLDMSLIGTTPARFHLLMHTTPIKQAEKNLIRLKDLSAWGSDLPLTANKQSTHMLGNTTSQQT